MKEMQSTNTTPDALDTAPSKQQRGIATSENILRAATRLMAENGYNGVSLRRICSEANVNLALMTYHFGTKDKLLLAIFQRGTAMINNERARLLEDLEKRFPNGDPPLEELLFAFINPTLSASKANRADDLHFLRLSGRLATDPSPEVREVVSAVYDEVAVRFVRLLHKACNHLSIEEFFMRMIFFYGAMLYTRADTGRVEALAEKLDVNLPDTEIEDASKYLIRFLAAGFRAPAT
jgi:AcrR family transcriptional regulator